MKMFDTLIRMSISGAVMVLIIAVIRAVFIHKLPKKSFVLMWEIVIARLLIPFEIPSVISIYTLFGNVFQSKLFSQNQNVTPNGNIQQIPDKLSEGTAVVNTISHKCNIPIWQIVWIAGTVLFTILFIALYVISYRKHRFAERIHCELLSEFKTKRNVEVRVLSGISSPLTYGLISPTILLPKSLDLNNLKQFRLILAHEITHIKRFDILRKFIVIIAVCIHWWNPLVWTLLVLYNRDIELVCDDAVIRKFCTDRHEYARTLVDLFDNSTGIIHNYFSKNSAEERILSIMKHKKTSAISFSVAVFLTIGITTVFATSSISDDWHKLNDVSGYENIFSSPITSVTLKTGENNNNITNAYDQPFVERWSEFLSNLELRKINKSDIQIGEVIVIETDNGEFSLYINGKLTDDNFYEKPFVINGDFYEYKSTITIPCEWTLNPFDSTDLLFNFIYDKE